MATNKPFISHHYDQLASKFRSKSSDSLINVNSKNESAQKQKQATKTTKMKKSHTVFSGFETKPFHRRFSFFRLKRSSQLNDNSNLPELQDIIDQLRRDLQTKTDELEAMKEYIDHQRTSNIIQPSNESIEQAIQLQAMLNTRLEEMLTENDLLKKSIQDLESFAQEQKSKREKKKVQFHRSLMSTCHINKWNCSIGIGCIL